MKQMATYINQYNRRHSDRVAELSSVFYTGGYGVTITELDGTVKALFFKTAAMFRRYMSGSFPEDYFLM